MERILAAASAHTGSLPQSDDMTVVVIRRLPVAEEAIDSAGL